MAIDVRQVKVIEFLCVDLHGQPLVEGVVHVWQLGDGSSGKAPEGSQEFVEGYCRVQTLWTGLDVKVFAERFQESDFYGVSSGDRLALDPTPTARLVLKTELPLLEPNYKLSIDVDSDSGDGYADLESTKSGFDSNGEMLLYFTHPETWLIEFMLIERVGFRTHKTYSDMEPIRIEIQPVPSEQRFEIEIPLGVIQELLEKKHQEEI
jgi:hypothetical protein